MANPITIKFSIWNEAEMELFTTNDYEELKSNIDLTDIQLLQSIGNTIKLKGKDMIIKNIHFLVSRMKLSLSPKAK